MPQVPYSPVPGVQPSSGGTPYMRLPNVPAAFGTTIGEAEKGLGQTMEQAGTTLANDLIYGQQLKNEADVNQATTDYLIQSGELDNKFRLMQGKDPQDNLQTHVDSLRQLRETTRDSLTNPMAQKMFDRETMRRFGYDVVNASNYAATQMKQFTKNSYEASQIATLDRLLKDPNNEAYMDDVIKSTIDSEAKVSHSEGDPEDLTRMKIDAKIGRIVKGVTGSIAKENPDKASTLLQKFKGKIPESDYIEAEQKIKDRAVQYHAALDARALTGGIVPINHPVAQNAPVISQLAEKNKWNMPGSTFTPENIYRLVQQESAGKNMPPNQYGYAGYFQMRPKEFGYTNADFAGMSFAQQLDVYANQYLKKYGYTGTQDLGVMNAAPAYANKSDISVAYPAGSIEAAANPQWVRYSQAGGAVTVGGIKAWMQAGGQGLQATPEANLPDVARRAAELAKTHPLIAGDPIAEEKYLEQTLSHAQRNATLMRSQLNQQVKAYRSTIDSVLYNASQGDRGPTSLEEALKIDPNFQQTWEDAAKLSPTISKHINDTFIYNAKQDVPLTSERVARHDAAMGLAITNPDDFLKLSPASLDLPRTGKYSTNSIVEKQLSMSKKLQDTSHVNAALRTLSPMLNDAGVVPSRTYTAKAATFNQFVGALQSQLEAFQEEKKRPPNEAEVMTMGAGLLRTTTSNWIWPDERAFEVPKGQATSIGNTFKARYGREPNPAEVSIIYQRMMRNASTQQ